MSIKKKSAAMKFLEEISGGPLTMAQLLWSIREGQGLSQVAFAKKLGISRAKLCDIEKDRRFVNEELAAKFAVKLKESKEQFIRISIQDRLEKVGLHYKVNIEAA